MTKLTLFCLIQIASATLALADGAQASRFISQSTVAGSGIRCQAMDLAEGGNFEVTREVELHYTANSMSFHYFEGIDNPAVGQMFAGSLARVGKIYDFRGGDLRIQIDGQPITTSFVEGRPIGRLSATSDSTNGVTLLVSSGKHAMSTPNIFIDFGEITTESSVSNNQLEIAKFIQMRIVLAPPGEEYSHWTDNVLTFELDKCQVFTK